MMLVPHIAVVDSDTLRLLELEGSPLRRAEDAVERVFASNPEFADKAERNGWTARSIALGRLLHDVAQDFKASHA